MQVTKQDLGKAQIELTVELSPEEFALHIKKGAEEVAMSIKIEGFRPGKVPFDVLKQKVGEMTILEEASHFAIRKTLDEVIKNNVPEQVVGAPKIDIIKLAPGNPFIYKAVCAILPTMELSAYKDLGLKQKAVEVSEADIEKMINELREMRAKEIITEGEIKDGYKVIVDVEMFLDNIPLDGGQNKGVAVVLGKNYFVPGFDKKIIGAKKNDERNFSLPYPADYHMKNLAGKMVEFKVKINEVYERVLPELNDELAIDFGLKKLEELKNNIKQGIEEQKSSEAKQAVEREMLEKIVAKTKFGHIPEMLVENEAGVMMSELEQSVANQGGTMADYLQSIKKTADQLTLDLLPEAVKRVQVSLMIREVAKLEKISVSEEEVDNQVKEIKKHYQDKPEMMERFNMPEYKSYVWNVLSSRKVIDQLREWNIEAIKN